MVKRLKQTPVDPGVSFTFGDEVSKNGDDENFVITEFIFRHGTLGYILDGDETVIWSAQELHLNSRASEQSFQLALVYGSEIDAEETVDYFCEGFQVLAIGDRIRVNGAQLPSAPWPVITHVQLLDGKLVYLVDGEDLSDSNALTPDEVTLMRRATAEDLALAISTLQSVLNEREDGLYEGDDGGEGEVGDLMAWPVSFTYYEYNMADGHSDVKFHRQIMYAHTEESIRAQIAGFMPDNGDPPPSDIVIGAPVKL